MPLSGKQRHYLRGLGHALEPIVHVGKEGLTDGVTAALHEALARHELVKVKLGGNAPEERHAAAEQLAGRAGGEVVQVLGNVLLLYRPRAEEPGIELP